MRRMFRRQIRKRLAQDIPPILREANFVFDKSEYGRPDEVEWTGELTAECTYCGSPVREQD